jgi:hypothetical protein
MTECTERSEGHEGTARKAPPMTECTECPERSEGHEARYRRTCR